jgi:predicted component of type VI protein secretion system
MTQLQLIFLCVVLSACSSNKPIETQATTPVAKDCGTKTTEEANPYSTMSMFQAIANNVAKDCK